MKRTYGNTAAFLIVQFIIFTFTAFYVYGETASLIIGTSLTGEVRNQPAGWPKKAGSWNGKAARYNPAAGKLVFETYRQDILGGSVKPGPGRIKAPGVDIVFAAGPDTGNEERTGTAVLYISGEDGSNPLPLGDIDITDGKNGCRIFETAASSTGISNSPIRQNGAVIYANQNKDLAAWHPSGKWLFFGLEMKRHALSHTVGCSEIGMFTNLWAVSSDGKIWIQLTHYENTWTYYDPVAMIPYSSLDGKNAPESARYPLQNPPYPIFFSSKKGFPPPAIGTMRPTVGNSERNGLTKIVWAERVGLSADYPWGGALFLAAADIVIKNSLPGLINYKRCITPTREFPDGIDLWKNPEGNVIGSGYEPWSFSPDDSEILFASDTFIASALPSGKYGPWTQIFTDVIAWNRMKQTIVNLTSPDKNYQYLPNAGPEATRMAGYWEEPAVYAGKNGILYVAFGSGARLSSENPGLFPVWDPMKFRETFGLETFIITRDRSIPAKRITSFNTADRRVMAYPTDYIERHESLLITAVPGGMPGENPPGAIYSLKI